MVLKNYFFIFLSLFALLGSVESSQSRYLFLPKNTTLQQVRDGQKECIYDVDDVLMNRRNIGAQIRAYGKFLRNHATVKQLFVGACAFTKQLIKHPINTLKAVRCFEEITDNQIAQHGSCFVSVDQNGKTFWERFKQVHADNVHWLLPMTAVVKEAYQNNAGFNIATNQSRAMVNMWTASPNNPLRKDGINHRIVFTKNAVLSDEGNIIKKPNQLYFERLMARCKESYDNDQYHIFIDDKEANVQAAVKEGFIGIVAKNADTVRQSLVELEVLKNN